MDEDVIIGNIMQIESKSTHKPTRFHVTVQAALFVIGFSVVFIIGWGGAATVFGQLFADYKEIVSRIGGILIILLGLFMLNVIQIPWLNYEKRGYWKPGRGGNSVSSFMMGVLFAAGWTPCIGPTLGAILTLGMSRESSGQAIVLSAGYALGLAIPFLLLGIGTEKALSYLKKLHKYLKWIERISGILLIIVGLLMLLNQMSMITRWALQNEFFIDVPFGQTDMPTITISILAGLLSFLSPCVLPLVPAYLGYLSGSAIQNLD